MGGTTTLYGGLVVGDSGNVATSTFHGAADVRTGGPTVTSGGFTLTQGNFDASSSTGTFKTGTGAVTLNGETTVEGATFTVGSNAAGKSTLLYGNVFMGSTAATWTVNNWANFVHHGQGNGVVVPTFKLSATASAIACDGTSSSSDICYGR